MTEARPKAPPNPANYLPLVKAIAGGIVKGLPHQVDLEDLVSAGECGLLDAAAKFDPAKKVPFGAYARFRIRGAILDSLRGVDPAGRDQRRKVKLVTAAVNELRQTLFRHPTGEEIASKLGMDLGSWQRLASELDVASLATISMSDFTWRSRDGRIHAKELRGEREEWPDQTCATHELADVLQEALARLRPRDRIATELYYWHDLSQKEIGTRLGVHEARVCQLLARSLGEMKAFLARRGIASPAVFEIAA
jgi:RNA polymerase sigma factor for flagellar operon FliA